MYLLRRRHSLRPDRRPHRSACGIEEGDGEAEIDAKLTRRVEEVGGDPAHLPYLRFLLSIDPGDPSVLEEDPMLRKPRMFEAFRDVLVAAVHASRRCS